MSLTEDAIPSITQNEAGPFNLQILDWKKIIAGLSHSRYRVVLSDGSRYLHGILAITLNPLALAGKLKQFTVLKLNEYICTNISTRMVCVVLQCEIIKNNLTEPIFRNPNGSKSIYLPFTEISSTIHNDIFKCKESPANKAIYYYNKSQHKGYILFAPNPLLSKCCYTYDVINDSHNPFIPYPSPASFHNLHSCYHCGFDLNSNILYILYANQNKTLFMSCKLDEHVNWKVESITNDTDNALLSNSVAMTKCIFASDTFHSIICADKSFLYHYKIDLMNKRNTLLQITSTDKDNAENIAVLHVNKENKLYCINNQASEIQIFCYDLNHETLWKEMNNLCFKPKAKITNIEKNCIVVCECIIIIFDYDGKVLYYLNTDDSECKFKQFMFYYPNKYKQWDYIVFDTKYSGYYVHFLSNSNKYHLKVHLFDIIPHKLIKPYVGKQYELLVFGYIRIIIKKYSFVVPRYLIEFISKFYCLF